MAKIEIYTSMFCGYCHAAKAMLKQKGVAYTEFDVMMRPGRRQEMMKRAGGRSSVPQIFIGETHIGGYDDMAAMEARGELDPLLAQS